MKKVVKLSPQSVGLAFLNQVGVVQLLTSKVKRRVIFKRCIRSLLSLDLLPADIHWEYLTLGVDKNGDVIIVVEGNYRNKRSVAKKTN